MNRGRRRGGVSSGFGSLRDGVKRRLFDPHAVPTLPDPQSIISRLTPLSTSQPQIDTVLPILDGQSTSNELPATKKFQNDLFEAKATMEFIFDCGPAMQNLPKRSFEGISIGQKTPVNSKKTSIRRIGAAHLLLKSCDISLWGDSSLLCQFSNPHSWYPKELTDKLKSKKSVKHIPAKRAKLNKKLTEDECDLDDLVISDRTLVENLDENENDDTVEKGAVEANLNNEDDADKDSDDARWNGEQVEDEEGDDLDNDYCDTYFDNGEGDIDDFNVMREDDDGGNYYD